MRRTVLLLLLQLLLMSSLSAQNKPYVILVSFDGFRWDYSQRGITPNLEKMKEKGVSAMSLRSAYMTNTFPNHFSIITGMYTESHGLISNNIWDPHTREKFSMATKESKWFLGEAFWETAGRNGIKSASYFWPGSEMDLEYRRPDYFKAYDKSKDYLERLDTLKYWLQLPIQERPNFITLYFHDTDTYGHKYGPESPEVNVSIARLDSIVGELYSRLEDIGMSDSVNVIISSDHGMTEMSEDRVINVAEILKDFEVKFYGGGYSITIECSEDDKAGVYQTLLANNEHYSVFLKENIPSHYHYSKHPFIPDIIMIPDVGWSLERSDTLWSKAKGMHGFEKDHTDMHGTFIAQGPAFKSGYPTGTLWNIDIYPLLCKIYGIEPRTNIDGKLERIEFILKGK